MGTELKRKYLPQSVKDSHFKLTVRQVGLVTMHSGNKAHRQKTGRVGDCMDDVFGGRRSATAYHFE
jgi:hypothetical protein